ncbi:MAG: hypothetical protein DMG56_11055 [Acidobacteria bacterium]|nr:MAG: hypothetical protein DMG56_11055 [Acidobacteriota bacterium]
MRSCLIAKFAKLLALATDREALIRYLLRGQAKLAGGALPPDHWAAEPNVAQYPYDPARAEQVLDAAGFPRKQDGIRAHLTLKCSTEEQARLIGAAFQEQWRRVGIQLELRPLELATLFSDVASAGLAPTPIRTFLNMLSRRSAFRRTAPIAGTIATLA